MTTAAQAGDGGLDGALSLTGRDCVNVAVGFMVFYGAFTVAKIGIDSAMQAQRERFDSKGQPPAATRAKESTLDGIVKILGVGLGIWQMSQQLPVVIEEGRRLLK